MTRAPLLVLLIAAATLLGGCLGVLRRDPVVEAVAFAPKAPLSLPVRESRPYWLLRAQAGWDGAHEVRYGGDPEDPAVATVRTVRFADVQAAEHAFDVVTPAYLFLAYRDRMTWEPRPFEYPVQLPGDEVLVTEYGVRTPPGPSTTTLVGQMTAIRAGKVVCLIESIGVTPDYLVPAIEQMVQAAYGVE